MYSPEFPGHSGGYVAVAGQEGIGINAVFWDEFSRHKGEQWIIVFERGGESEDSPSDDPSHPIRLSLGGLLSSMARFRFTGHYQVTPWVICRQAAIALTPSDASRTSRGVQYR